MFAFLTVCLYYMLEFVFHFPCFTSRRDMCYTYRTCAYAIRLVNYLSFLSIVFGSQCVPTEFIRHFK